MATDTKIVVDIAITSGIKFALQQNIVDITIISGIKSRLAIRVLNYCRPRINAKRLNDVRLSALVRSSTT